MGHGHHLELRSSQHTQWPHVCLSFPFAKSQGFERCSGPQCPKTFTEPHKQRAINAHFWERSPKIHLPGSQHKHSLFFPKKLQLRGKHQQGKGAEAGKPQPKSQCCPGTPNMHAQHPAPSSLAPFDLSMPKKLLLCFEKKFSTLRGHIGPPHLPQPPATI